MSTTHHLDHEQIHQEWNNALPPRLTIDPGDTVVFDTRDAANRFYSKESTHEDVMRRVPDVSLCERLLGVRAKVDIDDGLARTIEWQRAAVAGRAAG